MESASKVLSAYEKILFTSKDTSHLLGSFIPIPVFDSDLVSALCDEALMILKSQSPLIKINGKCIVAGDLHGNLLDLLRILKIKNFSNDEHFLFLGDYVDKGPFTIETVILLFALLCNYPNKIHLLRGNHEFSRVNGKCGFRNDIMIKYENDNLWYKINSVFDYLSIAALINEKVFCVHGGISPNLDTINDIDFFQMPFKDYLENDVISDLLWSDPNCSISYYSRSERGIGKFYGEKAVSEFIYTNQIKCIIRAHQYITGGIAKFNGNSLFSVFSSSNYLGYGNKCGILEVDECSSISAYALPPILIKEADFPEIPNTASSTHSYIKK
ncbi:Serine/threonine-protein phosphatase PP-X 1 [Tritrichomonas foetus]|uniref:Serine/threonine-protein phosphatase n=1 Tax=Tritrichomonas foetus TaxID=1144522 RepID=A0A1J4JY85_9EUKA|nr:Serine/threonine-protein phosphatase PP-X 1 [Tritrichomonas foetus]|eukprot:OHT03658.1 Serine/threonine-protein phosphatase PP-X 1 [Tritrichomonas foetus]